MTGFLHYKQLGLLDQNDQSTPQPDDPAVVAFTAAPATGAASVQPTALYLTEPGDTNAISVDDINQGSLNDCFLLASIGEIAMLQPSFISNMIQSNPNGSETVTLYVAADGKLPTYRTTSFAPITETVTNVFPSNSVNSGATQDVVNGVKEIWPQVLENAVAQLVGGYDVLGNGGSTTIAMEELTGQAATSLSPARLTLTQLLGFSKADDLIVMDTSARADLPDDLISNHSYMFEGVTGSGSSLAVNLLNPWGYDQPPPILFSQLSKGISEIDIGHLA